MAKPTRTAEELKHALRDALSGHPGAQTISSQVYPESRAGPEDANWNADYAAWGASRPHLAQETLRVWLETVARLRSEYDLD